MAITHKDIFSAVQTLVEDFGHNPLDATRETAAIISAAQGYIDNEVSKIAGGESDEHHTSASHLVQTWLPARLQMQLIDWPSSMDMDVAEVVLRVLHDKLAQYTIEVARQQHDEITGRLSSLTEASSHDVSE